MKKTTLIPPMLVLLVLATSAWSSEEDNKSRVVTSFGTHLTSVQMALPISVGLSYSPDDNLDLVASWKFRINDWFVIGMGEAWYRPEADWRMAPIAFSPKIKVVEFNFLGGKDRLYFEPCIGWIYESSEDDWKPFISPQLLLDFVDW